MSIPIYEPNMTEDEYYTEKLMVEFNEGQFKNIKKGKLVQINGSIYIDMTGCEE